MSLYTRIIPTTDGPRRYVSYDGQCWRYPEPEPVPVMETVWNGGLLFCVDDWTAGYSSGLGQWPAVNVDGAISGADWSFIGYGLGDKKRHLPRFLED